jgi:hypothetical protein
MRKSKSVASKKWLILGILLALVPLFQNMSLVPEEDDASFDIREIAPARPEGNWDSPLAQYIPQDMHATSLTDVQQSFLSHNFDPMLKDLELTYFPHGSGHGSAADSRSPASLGTEDVKEKASNWKLGVINPTKVRLMYSNPEVAEGFQVSCEAQTGQAGLYFRMSHPLTSKLNLGVTHETALRQSQIQVDYRW